MRGAVSEIIVYGFGEIVGAALRYLIGRQMDDKLQRPLAGDLLRRADDIVFSVGIEIALVKWRRIKRIEQLRDAVELSWIFASAIDGSAGRGFVIATRLKFRPIAI